MPRPADIEYRVRIVKFKHMIPVGWKPRGWIVRAWSYWDGEYLPGWYIFGWHVFVCKVQP